MFDPMKNRFLLFFLFFSFSIFSQKVIKGIIVDKNGLLIDPLDVLYENYWSYYEKIATYLPLDYEPKTDK